jgi:glycosyltransferase involved in cell wall biosynthesis
MKSSTINQKRLAIVCTHPIQYYVPLFQELAKVISLKVFFTDARYSNKRYDPGFRKQISWDLPMLKGYEYVFSGSKVIQLLKAFKPDQILIYGWPFRNHLRVMLYFRRKIWFRGDSIVSTNEHPLKAYFKTLGLRWVYRHADKAFYVGSNNKLYFLKYGLQEEQLVFAPHAVDNSRFGIADTTRASAIRKHFHIAETDLLILYAGKLNNNKNPFLLLQAFCNLNLQNTHLLFAGDGKSKGILKQTINQLNNVHLLPFQNQSEMPALYQCCDLFCLPSKSETWGLSINEAMAAGKAVLVSDSVGAAPELVDHRNGSTFKNNDLQDLQNKLQELMVSKKELHVLGLQSRIRIQNWSITQQVQIMLKELNNQTI